MEKHIEKEYKILVTKEQFYKLLSYYPKIKFITQINTYYDNEHFDIIKHHGAMRIREKENHYLFTLKKFNNNTLFEYECEVFKNDAAVFTSATIKETLDNFQIYGPFQMLAHLKTDRAVFESDDYELCFDINEYNGMVDYEIEYEYKREHNGLENFQNILQLIHLTYKENSISKIHRALHSMNIKID
ncbi:uncharacterized protein YjbK [Breznakia sp. PF5-3]|uniref:CYTH domain-containing protein n=1 Tax=unclassified Breznakia TaxID=2623764 RepID=UPI002405F652|nr:MULTISPECIES: CYTH domain-containing protein [unclassified Breznakia]MDL2276921.1 CYTH domain-containing protein [Breznakia sp. OttesenSCG-928-G09]MDF9825318.1 uncharacterized protein YjbK [Breznakia sp. PM6-1]MDF9836199.1 uncharacterized protein YjbK [Breznakia sp. PF5-3]MDF9838428.1 uncharacterized protein YjbK [Breznakia sp. PFB2-8]MDF9860444.1 uncharacterized protein YjbK [Breznakia sp. PH5-24]